MHLIRRSAFRAASSAPSFASQSRSITASPFVLRSKVQNSISASVFRRFNSDDASKVQSADGESSVVSEAVESVGGGVAPREYTPREPRQYDNNRGSYGGGRDGGRRPYDNNRGGDRGGYGGGRGGYGGDRGMARGGDRPPFTPLELPPTDSIYVGNLLFDVTAADIQREFEAFGKVKNVTIAADARGLSKGFGYVEFSTVEEATAAIEAKHMTILEGRKIVVNYMNKKPRPAREEGTQNPPSKTLFIGNLAFEMSDADLNTLFRDIRNVLDVRVAIDRRTGQPRGFAHADFLDIASATAGKEALAGKEVYGRNLRIDFSAAPRERSEQGDRRDRYPSREGSRDSF